MSIREVTRYVTTDSQEHKTFSDAQKRQDEIDFDKCWEDMEFKESNGLSYDFGNYPRHLFYLVKQTLPALRKYLNDGVMPDFDRPYTSWIEDNKTKLIEYIEKLDELPNRC